MPRKIRQLIADLEKHGFVNRGGKGSHRNFLHPSGVKITLSGGLGDDAKTGQELPTRGPVPFSFIIPLSRCPAVLSPGSCCLLPALPCVSFQRLKSRLFRVSVFSFAQSA